MVAGYGHLQGLKLVKHPCRSKVPGLGSIHKLFENCMLIKCSSSAFELCRVVFAFSFIGCHLQGRLSSSRFRVAEQSLMKSKSLLLERYRVFLISSYSRVSGQMSKSLARMGFGLMSAECLLRCESQRTSGLLLQTFGRVCSPLLVKLCALFVA